MSDRSRLSRATLPILLLAASLHAQDAAPGGGVNVADMKFTSFPGLPTCTTGSLQSGDPAKGPSIIFAKATAGCVIPWHRHTPSEHLMIVTGVAQAHMKDGSPLTLRAGAFALMPSRHIHQFRCSTACSLYIYSDAAFDIHYVDAQEKELTPEEALNAVKETAATEAK